MEVKRIEHLPFCFCIGKKFIKGQLKEEKKTSKNNTSKLQQIVNKERLYQQIQLATVKLQSSTHYLVGFTCKTSHSQLVQEKDGDTPKNKPDDIISQILTVTASSRIGRSSMLSPSPKPPIQ